MGFPSMAQQCNVARIFIPGLIMLQASMPKQYLPLLGQPIAMYSLQTLCSMAEIGEVVIVCDPSYQVICSTTQCLLAVLFWHPCSVITKCTLYGRQVKC